MTVIVIQVILAVFILVGGFIKLLRIPFQVEHWQHYSYPLWFMSVIGLIELIGAIARISCTVCISHGRSHTCPCFSSETILVNDYSCNHLFTIIYYSNFKAFNVCLKWFII